jgi:hypothetical protein
MTNSTFLWHVTMAVHEDRVHDLRQSRKGRRSAFRIQVRRPLGLYRRLMCRRQSEQSKLAQLAQSS